MKSMPRMALLLLLMLVMQPAGEVMAQPRGRRVVLSGESLQLPQRLAAVDRLVDPFATPDLIVKMVASLAPSDSWLPALSTVITERNSPERWDQVLEEYERL